MLATLFSIPNKQLSLGDIHIYFAEKDKRIAEISSGFVQEQRERLSKQYNLELKPIHIHIADDQKVYNKLSGDSSPAWSVGLAFHDKMLVKSPSFSRQTLKEYRQTLLHETAHLAVHDIPLPVWFNEGFAQYEAGQFDVRKKVHVSRSFWKGNLDWAYEIEYLMQVDRHKAEIMYAQSVAMFDFLVDYFSVGLVGKCLQYAKEFNDFEKGFKNAFLMDTESFEKLFREKAKKRYRHYILLDQNNVIWILSPIILVLGFVLTRIRKKRLLEKWEEEEKSQETNANNQLSDEN